jgi:hypothetical protein
MMVWLQAPVPQNEEEKQPLKAYTKAAAPVRADISASI